MLFTSEQILALANQLKSQLLQHLDPDTASSLDAQLSELLNQAEAGHPVEDQIFELLTEHFSDDASAGLFKYTQLPGQMSDIPAPKFQCPQCDYTWTRLRVGQATPQCPEHHVPLEPA